MVGGGAGGGKDDIGRVEYIMISIVVSSVNILSLYLRFEMSICPHLGRENTFCGEKMHWTSTICLFYYHYWTWYTHTNTHKHTCIYTYIYIWVVQGLVFIICTDINRPVALWQYYHQIVSTNTEREQPASPPFPHSLPPLSQRSKQIFIYVWVCIYVMHQYIDLMRILQSENVTGSAFKLLNWQFFY